MSEGLAKHPCKKLNNVGLGGLAFSSPKPLPVGHLVSVRFPLLGDDHDLSGRVVWIRQQQTGFVIGLQFDDPNQLYCLRMIEQVCHIEHYRQEIQQHEGRLLSSEEAASEWIQQFADAFPSIES